ncbi:MAG: hypothetical protein IRY96_07850 [Burkholderiales bacterium]|nr:hypothetical protein [Burkholderiales bacterium]PZN06158.1 MAG: hypothetical protein DIU74_00845 [Pseudomonadota bacterium]
MATFKSRTKLRPFWERGYKSHGYWAGKKKLGVVRLQDNAPPEEKYRWEAGTHAGYAATLIEGKRAVEAAVLLGISQLPLFETEEEPR